MAFGFGHLIVGWLLGKLFEKISKSKLSWWCWGALILGSILPDVDLIIDWTLSLHIHRAFTHSLVFALFIGFLVYVFFEALKVKEKSFNIALALGCGVCIHLIVDMFYAPGIMLLWPGKFIISYFSVVDYSPILLLPILTVETLTGNLKEAFLDMFLGVALVGYFFLTKRLKL